MVLRLVALLVVELLVVVLERRPLGRRRLELEVVMRLSPSDEQAVRDAVARAEQQTAGEIVVVVASRASSYALVGWAAALAGFALGALLLDVTARAGVALPRPLASAIVLQSLVAALLFLVVWPLRVRLVPQRGIERAVERAATLAFVQEDVHRTRDGTGVLVFVAQAERVVRILADSGASMRIAQASWDAIAAEVAQDLRAHGAAGLVRGVERIGEVLAMGLPRRDGDANELPDAPRWADRHEDRR